MHVRARRRTVVVLTAVLATAILLAACSGGSEPVEVGAAAEAPSAGEPGPTTTASAPPPAAAQAPSPVEGLTAAELQTVVEAPSGAGATDRRGRGPIADQVTVGGRTVWRITVPGRHQVLSSQVVVAVGGADVGEGVVTADLASLVTVAVDPALVVPGAAVTYRWGAGEPIAAGPLEVVR